MSQSQSSLRKKVQREMCEMWGHNTYFLTGEMWGHNTYFLTAKPEAKAMASFLSWNSGDISKSARRVEASCLDSPPKQPYRHPAFEPDLPESSLRCWTA